MAFDYAPAYFQPGVQVKGMVEATILEIWKRYWLYSHYKWQGTIIGINCI